MCCSSVLLGFQRERGKLAGLFLPHLHFSRGGDGKASFLPSVGLTSLATWMPSAAQRGGENAVLSEVEERGRAGKVRRSFSSYHLG